MNKFFNHYMISLRKKNYHISGSWIIYAVLFSFCSCARSEQKNKYIRLPYILDSIMIKDQLYRKKIHIMEMDSSQCIEYKKSYGLNYENLKQSFLYKQIILDSLNQIFIDSIIRKIGYPGKSMVGTGSFASGVPSNEVAWYVIQHSAHIEQYLALILDEVKKGEIPKSLGAMMLDRYLVQLGHKQVFGSQFEIIETGRGSAKFQLYPIIDTSKIDSLRTSVGLPPLTF